MATQIDMAEQQLYGWNSANHGERLISMINGMGLTRKEWDKMRSSGIVDYLGDDQINEVTDYLRSTVY